MSAPGAYAKGVPIVRKFPFAFDSPGLLTGRTVYTPMVGDLLLDAWLEIGEPWDGTTPLGDAGPITGPGDSGFWGSSPSDNAGPIDMGNNDSEFSSSFTTLGGSLLLSHMNTHDEFENRFVPGRFTDNDRPIKIVVSQTGVPGGADPGSTQGSAILYLVTVKPL